MDLAAVRALDLTGLERLFTDVRFGPRPSGVYRGTQLALLETAGARKPLWRIVDRVAFGLLPFGVDFQRNLWWFGHPRLAAGRFRLSPAPVHSRWRETEVLALEYDVSRLPRRVRDGLYDEVKPITERLCLGLGGLNREVGEGDHFFFALERM